MGNGNDRLPARTSSGTEVAAFLRRVAATPAGGGGGRRGRLLFAVDATASREPTWDMACGIQSEMFAATAALGGLEIQLAFYRGFGDFRVTPWLTRSEDLVRRMVRVRCLAGRTQIRRLLRHALRETRKQQVDAVVFVGDVVEEDVDELGHQAGKLGLQGTPVFVFHEGDEPGSRRAFAQIARLTRGAVCGFDAGSARQLRELLTAVAVFSAGGLPALEDYGRRAGGRIPQLAHQIER